MITPTGEAQWNYLPRRKASAAAPTEGQADVEQTHLDLQKVISGTLWFRWINTQGAILSIL